MQDGADFRLTVHAPVTGKTWVLARSNGQVSLAGLRARPIEGRDAAALLERELGWQVPVAQLGYWIRGMRAPGPAQLVFREDGLPARINQNGWQVEYRDYDGSVDPPLPRRIFAKNGTRDVRVSIRRWELP
jgi:outer membrane lipoprotein LolB